MKLIIVKSRGKVNELRRRGAHKYGLTKYDKAAYKLEIAVGFEFREEKELHRIPAIYIYLCWLDFC